MRSISFEVKGNSYRVGLVPHAHPRPPVKTGGYLQLFYENETINDFKKKL